MKYAKLPKKSTRNKVRRPKETHNPFGEIDHVKYCTQLEMKVFDNLGMAKADIKETYLAAFLACWLCKFVLPWRIVNLIRPGVFKVASKMAQGETISLVVPVLANIYNGLNEIACSSKPRTNASIFPIHFLYGWLGEYFDTHFISPSWNHPARMTYYADEFSAKCFDDLQAQALIMSCKGIKLDHLALLHKERVHWTDNESISVTKASYLISLRSSYLSLRQGNHRVIQLYYSHQIFKQFGYPQDLLEDLPEIFCTRTLETVYQHWESCIRLGTYSKVTIPDY